MLGIFLAEVLCTIQNDSSIIAVVYKSVLFTVLFDKRVGSGSFLLLQCLSALVISSGGAERSANAQPVPYSYRIWILFVICSTIYSFL